MNKIIEVFKTVPDFPAYRVSNFGRVQSRWQNRPTYVGFLKQDIWRDVRAGENQKGYKQIVLCDGKDKRVTARVHNLVTSLFIGPKPVGQVVRHLDSNPRNNRLDNLMYGTYLENENDKIANGTWNTRNGGARLLPSQVLEIRRRASAGERQEQLAEAFGVSRPTVTRIVNKTIWRSA